MMPTVRTKLSPPDLAKRWGIDPAKIIAWIRSGELRAINASTRRGGRPRYLIDVADIAAFEATRDASPTPRPVRRCRRNRNEVDFDFFPE